MRDRRCILLKYLKMQIKLAITGNTFRLSISKILHIHTIKFQAFATLAQDTKTQKVRLWNQISCLSNIQCAMSRKWQKDNNKVQLIFLVKVQWNCDAKIWWGRNWSKKVAKKAACFETILLIVWFSLIRLLQRYNLTIYFQVITSREIQHWI